MKTLWQIILCAMLVSIAGAAEVIVRWDRNPETEVTGYNVYWGKTSRSYTSMESTSNTTITLTNVSLGTNYFAVTAFAEVDGVRLESPFSDEVSALIVPGKPTGVVIPGTRNVTLKAAATVNGPWLDLAAFNLIGPFPPVEFYRLEIVK